MSLLPISARIYAKNVTRRRWKNIRKNNHGRKGNGRMPSWTIQKVNGKPQFLDRCFNAIADYLDNGKDGRYEVEAKRSRKNKSQQQLGAIFGLAIQMIKAEFDDRGWDTSYLIKCELPTGNEITIDFLKEYLYATCGVYDEKGIVRLSRANTAQAAQFFDATRNFASSQWGIYVPEPNKNWRTTDDRREGQS
jgi:hypothetical protein